MGLERRGRADQGQPGANPQGEEPRARPELKVKSFEIGKRLIVEAWEKVRANNGAPGVDAVGIGLFEEQLRDNLFKVWNRMSSGSYFPGPVRGVEIPEDHGEGVRLPGVPNTGDRVAQTAAAMLLEEKLEPVFHRDSYGYRPGRSAHDALAVCRRRCWTQDWVLDLDVRRSILKSRAGSTITEPSTAPSCVSWHGASTSTSSGGPCASSSDSAASTPKRWPGCRRCISTSLACSPTGSSSRSPKAGLWGPDDGRPSRPVLRAAGGETPPADSPGCEDLGAWWSGGQICLFGAREALRGGRDGGYRAMKQPWCVTF
jgi:hypothetical protein